MWLREFPDKSANFGILLRHVYSPLRVIHTPVNVSSFWAEFVAVWSKYYAWLREFPDKSANFGILYGHVYVP